MEDFIEEIKNRPERLCLKCGKCKGKIPASFWDEIPEGCGYYGWFFQKREEIKQKIRKQKERMLLLQVSLIKAGPEQTQRVNESIEKIKEEINRYSQYGSWDW